MQSRFGQATMNRFRRVRPCTITHVFRVVNVVSNVDYGVVNVVHVHPRAMVNPATGAGFRRYGVHFFFMVVVVAVLLTGWLTLALHVRF